MGKTPKPISIWVPDGWERKPEIKALADKGHSITYGSPDTSGVSPGDFDLIIGPNCWRMDDTMLRYLNLAITAARAVKYPRKDKDEH